MPPFVSPRPVATPQNPPASNMKMPSPNNYFGFQSSDSSFFADSPQHTKTNWSPPSTTVRSIAAASPSVLPLDQNPEFDAFRRQSEGKAFNLGGLSNNFKMSAPPAKVDHRRMSSRTEQPKETRHLAQSKTLDPSAADLGRSPKRVLSPGSMILPEEARRASPASFTKSEPGEKSDSQPRFALPLDDMHGMNGLSKARGETLPASSSDLETQLMATPQRVINLLESRAEQVLLLDLRVQTYYAKSHITGALNLCIPTTLLKRPSFTVQKLADAFKDDDQRRRFETWRNSSYIVVYDSSSALLKDAQICLNTIKKFRSEGYNGTLYIIKGGFNEFSRRFSAYVDQGADSSARDVSNGGVDTEGPDVAPVVGGCPMPVGDKPANPFFGNIRQNMDLIGGVGQIPLKHPSTATASDERDYPEWLRTATDDRDQGKKVAHKFEQIERREKKRMEDALSGQVSFGTPKKQHPDNCVQIAGLEKGNKNRYNNIWPFEHSRVKLQGVPNHACDYINASHVSAAWSNKRYISTQAPIPATFNDFWNIVWQQDIRVVVMLTAEKEGAQVKAHNYWENRQYGHLHLDYLSEKRASIDPSRIHRNRPHARPSLPKRTSTGPQVPHTQLDPNEAKTSDEPYVIVRRFTLSHDKYPFEPMREITQLQYSNWPDFGAPAHPTHLLGLVEQCDNVVRSTSKTSPGDPQASNHRPVLVHCSAGCGRTGTFCTVDSVIDMLKRQRLSRGKQRQGMAMDVDDGPPAAKSSKKDQSSGGDFFGSQQSQYEDPGEGVEGGWVLRDDQDLVEKTVEDFRHQRLSMVQSLRQYVLCYESVMEWLAEQQDSKGT
ncbi:phosphotyrosine-specific ptp2-like protein [Vermiconidia calcicola]|uniref:Phosphotyrosine-specific ptp2-like protein n=1 Tax=Vermiconidia calcicola TaxID=1690605 RepID=A0ACC3NWD3_9PEZI|nr:phosphotyrosine-specific ptp2-like protein [Vermiconidia calcicola]